MNPSNQGKTGTHIPFIFILFLALFSVSVFPDNVNAKALKNATFAYLDVAQGNAELIKIGNQAVLIDTGKHSEYSTLHEGASFRVEPVRGWIIFTLCFEMADIIRL